jgi:hypothetical protein
MELDAGMRAVAGGKHCVIPFNAYSWETINAYEQLALEK